MSMLDHKNASMPIPVDEGGDPNDQRHAYRMLFMLFDKMHPGGNLEAEKKANARFEREMMKGGGK